MILSPPLTLFSKYFLSKLRYKAIDFKTFNPIFSSSKYVSVANFSNKGNSLGQTFSP